jgi:putative transposase
MGFNKRELKGLLLAINGHVQCDGNSCFKVRSESSDSLYEVSWKNRKWICSCEDYKKRGRKCKHIFAVIYYLTIRQVVVGIRVAEEKVECPHCQSSDYVIKRGYAYEKTGKVQRYYCKKCGRRFNYRSGLEGRRGEALAIVLALDLYFRGLSLRQISEHLESVYGVKASHTTIHGWIKRYVELVSHVTDEIKVKTGSRWHCDESKLKVKGRHIILWSVLDSETKVLIAQQISLKRDAETACKVLNEALGKAHAPPSEVVTDGFQAYSEAIRKAFPCDVMHILGPLNGPINNNEIERYFRTVKQRFKSVFSFGNLEGAEMFAKGFKIFYNMLKEHKALGDKSPMEASGLESAKCWQDLIKRTRLHKSEY